MPESQSYSPTLLPVGVLTAALQELTPHEQRAGQAGAGGGRRDRPSMIAVEGQPFHDPAADAALREGLAEELADEVELHELDLDVDDEAFALAMADRLHEMMRAREPRGGT